MMGYCGINPDMEGRRDVVRLDLSEVSSGSSFYFFPLSGEVQCWEMDSPIGRWDGNKFRVYPQFRVELGEDLPKFEWKVGRLVRNYLNFGEESLEIK